MMSMRSRKSLGEGPSHPAPAGVRQCSPVLFCRAALSAMVSRRASGPIVFMRRAAKTDIYSRRLRLSSREIGVALALTVAAAAAIVAAIDRVRQPLEDAPVAAAAEPAPAQTADR
jgi:hypothetical protein